MTILTHRQVFSDFSGGHYGALGPFRAAPNQFRGVNVQTYANGTVGPRPGWKLLETFGTAPSPTWGNGSKFYGLIWIPDGLDGNDRFLFVSYSDGSSSTRTLLTRTMTWSNITLAAPVNDMLLKVPGGGNIHTYWENYAMVGGTRYTNLSADTIATMTYPDNFSPRASCVYKSRMYSWGDLSFPGRIYYSDAGNFYNVSAGAYFDVGNHQRNVMHCWPLRDSLLILALPSSIDRKQNEAEWWVLQGANPLTGSLRLLGRAQWPSVGEYGVQFGEAVLWLDTLYNHGVVIHNGSEVDTHSLGRLKPRADSGSVVVKPNKSAVTYGEPGVFFPYRVGEDPAAPPVGEYDETGLQAWELVNGTWTKALYWNGAMEHTVTNGHPFLWSVSPWEGDKLLACTNTSEDGSGAYKFFTRPVTLNRPSHTGDDYADPTEAHADVADSGTMNCQMWLPCVQSEEGNGIRVRKVIVDFDYWKNSLFSPANTADLTVQIGNFRQADGHFSTTEEYRSDSDRLAPTLAEHPKPGRFVFRFPETGWYSACQVRFTALRNVAIDRVTVIYEENSQEPQ